MPRNFGSTGASSLVRAATAAASRAATYDDQAAAFEYDLSAKTPADFKKYNDYLAGRVKATSNVDPAKALSLQRTAVSANRTFNSSQINRATTDVKFGNSTNRDKYGQLQQLQQAAVANGDDNLAQSLYSQMASLSVTIQNEDQANAARSEADQAKALAAYKKGYAQQAAQLQDGIKQLNAAKVAGEITPADYNDRLSQIYLGNGKVPGLIALTQQAAKDTGDPDLTYQNKLDQWASDKQVQSFVNGNKAIAGANGNLFGQVITKGTDGTYSFKDRPSSEVTGNQVVKDASGKPVLDANGHVATLPTFAQPQAFTDKNGAINGFQYATNINPITGQPAPGTGAGAIRQIDASELNHDDPSGVPYFINEAGQKKFVGKDPTNGKAIMGDSPDVVNGTIDGKKPEGASSYDPVKFWSDALDKATPGAKNFLSKLPLLGNLINRNNAAAETRQQAINLAAAQKQAEARHASDALALQAQQAQQAKLLPVFRAPAPAPAPAPTNQYQLPALPAPRPLPGNSGISTPASTGNYQKDVLNLGRSLGGLM